ncbi:MAG: hypothetical protein ACI8Z7_000984 [Candidatus Nanohaloarchaea archaeon]|jgi:hypothetical protein
MEILLSGVNLSSQALTEGYDETSKSISPEEFGNAPTYGRKLARWLGMEEEVYVRDNTDLEDQKDYTVEYREGRFGSSILDEFDDVDEALEEGKEIAQENLGLKLQ